MNGWFLTDSAVIPAKWRIPTLVIPAGNRVIIFASGKDRAIAGAELHTSFKMKKEGGYVALVKPDQSTVASAWTYGPQRQNASYQSFVLCRNHSLDSPALANEYDQGWRTAGIANTGNRYS